MENPTAPRDPADREAASAHRAPLSLDDQGKGPTIAAAVDLFFGDLRLAPRTKKTYWHGIAKFLRHLSQHEGDRSGDCAGLSLTARPRHVVRGDPGPSGYPHTGRGIANADGAEQHLRGAQVLLIPSSYDLNTDLAGDRIKTRISAMMPRFAPPPPDVKLSDLEEIVDVRGQPAAERRSHSWSCGG